MTEKMTSSEAVKNLRWKLSHLACLIAIVALGFATLGVAGTTLIGLMAFLVQFAPTGKKSRNLYWLLACYPWFLLLVMHLVSFEIDGGNPNTSARIAPSIYLIIVLFCMTPFVVVALIFWTIWRSSDPSLDAWQSFVRLYPLIVIPMIWAGGFAFLRWDPFKILNGFGD